MVEFACRCHEKRADLMNRRPQPLAEFMYDTDNSSYRQEAGLPGGYDMVPVMRSTR